MVLFALAEGIDIGNLVINKREFWQNLQHFNIGAGVGTLGSSGAGNQRSFLSLCQRVASVATLVDKSKYRHQGQRCRQQV